MKIDQVRVYALSLPAVIEAPHHDFSSFRVGDKICVTVPPDQAIDSPILGSQGAKDFAGEAYRQVEN